MGWGWIWSNVEAYKVFKGNKTRAIIYKSLFLTIMYLFHNLFNEDSKTTDYLKLCCNVKKIYNIPYCFCNWHNIFIVKKYFLICNCSHPGVHKNFQDINLSHKQKRHSTEKGKIWWQTDSSSVIVLIFLQFSRNSKQILGQTLKPTVAQGLIKSHFEKLKYLYFQSFVISSPKVYKFCSCWKQKRASFKAG